MRAPFVGVDVGPWGTRVRAPFTRVDSPRYGVPYDPYPYYGDSYRRSYGSRYAPYRSDYTPYRSPQYAAPYRADSGERMRSPASGRPALSPDEMDWDELRRYLSAAAERLEQRLARRDDGAALRRQLQPGAVADFVAGRENAPPDEEAAAMLTRILEQYRNATAQAVGIEGFREVLAGLEAITAPPLERQQRVLAANAARLQEDLRRFRTGETWQRYLALPEELTGEPTVLPSSQTLDETLRKYERVVVTPEYRNIANLESFQRTRSLLIDYAQMVDEVVSASGPSPGDQLDDAERPRRVAPPASQERSAEEDQPPPDPVPEPGRDSVPPAEDAEPEPREDDRERSDRSAAEPQGDGEAGVLPPPDPTPR